MLAPFGLSLLVVNCCEAQRPLFTLLEPSSLLALQPDEAEKLGRMRALPLYESIVPIVTLSLPEAQKEGVLLIPAHDREEALMYISRTVTTGEDGDFVWHGDLQGNTYGKAVFIREDGNVFGEFSYGDQKYQVLNLGTLSLLAKLTKGLSTSCANGNMRTTNNEMRTVGPRKEDQLYRSSQPCPGYLCNKVRVLTLYTPSAAQLVANINQTAQVMLANAREALVDSDISTGTLELVDAGVRPIDGSIEQSTNPLGAMAEFRDNLQQQGVTPNNVIRNLRHNLEADLVIALVGQEGGAQGASYPNNVGDSDYGFAVVKVDNPHHSYAHELFHNFGCKHESNTSPPVNPYALAYEFGNTGGVNQTLMWSSGGPGRIVQLSNPDVSFNGAPTGVTNVRDNARNVKEMACTVGDYIDSTPEIGVQITGFNSLGTGSSATWCTSVSCCSNIVDYNWSYSYDGFSYTNFYGSNCASRTMSSAPNLYLRVTVTCDNGKQATDVHLVRNFGGSGGGPEPRQHQTPLHSEVYLTGEPTLDLTVYPTSATSTLSVSFSDENLGDLNGPADVFVTDLRGTVLYRNRLGREAVGTHQIDVTAFAPGLYMLHFRTEKGVLTSKFVKQ